MEKEMKTLKQFLSMTKVGLILRVFSTKEDDVPKRITMLDEMIGRATSVNMFGNPVIRRIDVLVWADSARFDGQCDSGHLAPVLREHYRDDRNVFIHEVRNADLFCGLLNFGIATQLRAGCEYSIVASAEANSYWNAHTLERMLNAVVSGARAVGIAINELSESILAGRIANTFAMWRNVDLLTVGGFDMRAAKPANDRLATYMRGWDAERGEVYYQTGGVEEMIPLARLVEYFGPCIAPILPVSDDGEEQRYEMPNRDEQPELWLRHISKFGTKFERQSAHLASIGFDPSYLEGGVMDEYRNQ